MTLVEPCLPEGSSWASGMPPLVHGLAGTNASVHKKGPRIRVALIFGGWGSDYDASCASAAAILASLDPASYDVSALHLHRSGQWVVGDESVTSAAAGLGAAALASALAADPDQTFAAGFRAAANLLRDVDVAFPAIHGSYGADGSLQSVLDGIGVPYVGSGVFASIAGMNRVLIKQLVGVEGVSVADGEVLRAGGDKESTLAWREVSLAVLEHPDGRLEVGPPFAMYAGLDSALLERLQTLALTTFRALHCSGLLQLNFRIHAGHEPVLSEVCTLPVLTPDATFPRIWQTAGMAFVELLETLIRSALSQEHRAAHEDQRAGSPSRVRARRWARR